MWDPEFKCFVNSSYFFRFSVGTGLFTNNPFLLSDPGKSDDLYNMTTGSVFIFLGTSWVQTTGKKEEEIVVPLPTNQVLITRTKDLNFF